MMTDEQELMAQIDATFVTGPAQPWLSVAGGVPDTLRSGSVAGGGFGSDA